MFAKKHSIVILIINLIRLTIGNWDQKQDQNEERHYSENGLMWSGSLWAMGEGGSRNKRRSWSTWGAGDHGDDGIGDHDISNDGVFPKFSN